MKGRHISDGLYKFRPALLAQYPAPSSDLIVSWRWYDEAQGIVEWTFRNESAVVKSGVLLRGVNVNGQNYDPYYFGDAFWPVYWANSDGRGASAISSEDNFGVEWAVSQTPLVDHGVENNVAPIAPVLINRSKWVVAFIFTLSPGQKWGMLEGGFSAQYQPYPVGVYEVSPLSLESICIGYNPQSVVEWDLQSHTDFQGYTPNPRTFTVLPFSLNGPEVSVFGDRISYGKCSPGECGYYLKDAIDELKKGHLLKGLRDLVKAVECVS